MILKNKVIIVTGGSGLIGKEIVADIKREGGIAINTDITVDTDIHKACLHVDVTNDESVINAVKLVNKHFGKIDGLVNSAYPRTADFDSFFEETTMESWRKNIDMQLNSCFLFCQKVLAVMDKQKSGSIVNIGSIYGVVGNDFSLYEDYRGSSAAAYPAIKGGIINFTRYLASYYGKKNIRINCISPGGIFDNQQDSFLTKYESRVPLGRMGNPDDIAPVVSFMLSEKSKYITGQNIMVDGGWTVI
jgi:NAD(P)-dependent dehydrogenase (short-subunit alcohol dehydrogenase family)